MQIISVANISGIIECSYTEPDDVGYIHQVRYYHFSKGRHTEDNSDASPFKKRLIILSFE